MIISQCYMLHSLAPVVLRLGISDNFLHFTYKWPTLNWSEYNHTITYRMNTKEGSSITKLLYLFAPLSHATFTNKILMRLGHG